MPLFSYRATNDDNKEVRGSIESPDELNARKALEDLNLDVIEIAEASRIRQETAAATPAATAEQPMPVFAFEGTDTSGAVRRGTMQAQGKYEAFKKLRDDQKLFLTMLSPVGVLPQYKDAELDQWQRGVKTSQAAPATAPTPSPAVKVQVPQPVPVAKAAPRPTIGFTNIPDAAKTAPAPSKKPVTQSQERYHPLTGTLRLYAGWLLAWYGLFVAVGYYSVVRMLPWDVPFVQAFYLSPLIFTFTVAIFLFLMLSAIHKALKGGMISGIAFTVIGVVAFFGIRILS